jgi:small subunit ribosomal protein S3
MIERDFVQQKKKEFQVQEFISATLKNVGHSHTKVHRTPLGEKVVIHTSRPGLVVGRKGQNISNLTGLLAKEFKLEKPQVEISEIEHPDLDPNIVAEKISSAMERFGSNRFKGIMHRAMEDVLNAGALGVEIRLSGKLPSSRAKSWRVYGGYLRKCGDAALINVRRTVLTARLKPGVVGIKVRILPPGVLMPDDVKFFTPEVVPEVKTPEEAPEKVPENAPEKAPEEAPVEKKPAKKKRAPRKKKAAAKKEAPA